MVLNKNIDKLNLKPEKLITYLLALTNCYYINASNELSKKNPESNIVYEELFSNNAQKAGECENMVCVINMVINYINYYKKTSYYDKNKPVYKVLTQLNKIIIFGQILYSYQEFYKKCLFDEYKVVETLKNKTTLSAKIIDNNYEKIRSASEYRISKYFLEHRLTLENQINIKQFFKNLCAPKIKSKKHPILMTLWKNFMMLYLLLHLFTTSLLTMRNIQKQYMTF